MGRLTTRTQGNIIKCLECKDMDYCYSELCDGIFDALDKLKEYEDLEEQGLLLRLPCKVGDKLYFVGEHADGKREILSVTVNSIIDSLGYKDNIGKGIFLTKAEAEKKLAEMGE